ADGSGNRPDRLRRRRAAAALEQRRGAGRRTPASAGGNGQHGQSGGRPRPRQRGHGRHRGDPARGRRGRADQRRGDRRPPGHDQLRGHLRAQPACPARLPSRRRGAMTERASALELARETLRGSRCWVVGGAVRDELLGAAPSTDLDLVIAGEVAPAARALARAAEATAFSLSDEFGAWRVVARSRGWQADLNPLRGETLEADLRLRDLTINAIAAPLCGGELIDPLGGAADLASRRLRIAAPDALEDDPLRALRLVRLGCGLDLRDGPKAGEGAPPAATG